MGALSPAGSRGQSPRWGSGGGAKPPWSWMPFCFCVSKGSCKFAQLLIFAKVSKSHSEWMSHCLTTHLRRIYMLSRPSYPLTCSCRWIQTSVQFVVFHLLHTDRMPCTPCPKKYTPWLLTISCCNLSAILLINPLNTVRLSLRSHQRSSASSSLSDSAAESESWLFLPVIVASTKTPLKYNCSFHLVLCYV